MMRLFLRMLLLPAERLRKRGAVVAEDVSMQETRKQEQVFDGRFLFRDQTYRSEPPVERNHR